MSIDFRKPVPLYTQLTQEIKSRILEGDLAVGQQVESQHALARIYGVSLITVKKALADLIKDGVLYSRVGKGTYVARKPVEFSISKTKALGVVLTDLISPFFSLIVKGVEEAASKHGFNILLSNSSNVAEKEEHQIRHFIELGVSGLVVASMTHALRASRALREIHRRGFPYVMVSFLSDPEYFRVGADNRAGGRIATEHLVNLGYTTVGFINGERGNVPGEERRSGYEDALAHLGLQPDPGHQFRLRRRGERNDYQSGAELGDRIATMPNRPRALFVYNDLAALGVEHGLQRHGVRIPEDVAIVGFDDIGPAEYAPVPLTTVSQHTHEIGTRAVEILLQRIAGEQTPVLTILKPTLVVRASCGARHGGSAAPLAGSSGK